MLHHHLTLFCIHCSFNWQNITLVNCHSRITSLWWIAILARHNISELSLIKTTRWPNVTLAKRLSIEINLHQKYFAQVNWINFARIIFELFLSRRSRNRKTSSNIFDANFWVQFSFRRLEIEISALELGTLKFIFNINQRLSKGVCHYSSGDSSAPTILLPRIWVPSRPSMLLSFTYNQICSIFVMWKERK